MKSPKSLGLAQLSEIMAFTMRILLLFLLLGCCAAHGSGVVTNCSESDLDSALVGGGLVTFSCDGIIHFSGTKRITNEVVLDAGLHSVTLSGSNATRLFSVAPRAILRLNNLTIVNGRAIGEGGAISNGGHVHLERCSFLSNVVTGAEGQQSSGGAISHRGVLLTATDCSFLYNESHGGDGTNGITGQADGQTGGRAVGGAIAMDSGQVQVIKSTFAFNRVIGGRGGIGESNPSAPGNGGNGGKGEGAAVATLRQGRTTFFNSTIASNAAIGGSGGLGGTGSVVIARSGVGGSANGALYNEFQLWLFYSTVAGNRAVLGSPHTNGLETITTSDAVASLAALNPGSRDDYIYVRNTIISTEEGVNSRFAVMDYGANISSDGTCHLGSGNNTDPQILPLANNGGATLTMLPLPKSPAIDAASASTLIPLDQRGFVRGDMPDIGAVEFQRPRITDARVGSGKFNINVELENGIPAFIEHSDTLAIWTTVASITSTNRRATFEAIIPEGGEQRDFYRVRGEP